MSVQDDHDSQPSPATDPNRQLTTQLYSFSYTQLAEQFHEQIIKVFIRDITSSRIQKTDTKSAYELAAGIPSNDNVQVQQQPPKLPDRRDSTPSTTSSPTSTRSTESFYVGTGAIESSNASAAAAAATPTSARSTPTDELMPGGPPPTEVSTVKSPYELWVERIENCRKRLSKDVLTLFDDTKALQNDQRVNEALQIYKVLADSLGVHEEEDEWERERGEKNEDEEHHHFRHADHMIHRAVEKLEDKFRDI